MQAAFEGHLNSPITYAATSNVVTVESNAPVWDAFEIILKNQFRRLLVLDNGKLVGIATERDVFKWVVKVTNEPNLPEQIKKLIQQN